MRENGQAEGQTQYWNEGMDWKRFALRMGGRLWVLLASLLAGALLAALVYLAGRALTAGAPQYRSEVLFAIRYNIQEDDETLKAFINEYNAYTWGDVMRSDPVMQYVTEALPGVDRQELEDALDTRIASDPEFLTAGFTAESAALSEQIRDAYAGAMAIFGQTMQERGLSAIEAWKTTPAVLVKPENRTKNAMGLGALLGLLVSALWMAGYYVLDDRLLLVSDLERRYRVPALGYRTKDAGGIYEERLKENLSRLASQKGPCREVSAKEILEGKPDWDALRAAAVVLCAEWNTPCLRRLDLVFCSLQAQGIEPAGAVITGADAGFLNRYYGIRAGKKQKAEGERT